MSEWIHLSRRYPAEDTDGATERRSWALPLAPPMTWRESSALLAGFGRALQRLRPPPPRARSDQAPSLAPPPPPPPYLP
eukprot:14736826-Alexandrium_andersonii.AAC.1